MMDFREYRLDFKEYGGELLVKWGEIKEVCGENSLLAKIKSPH